MFTVVATVLVSMVAVAGCGDEQPLTAPTGPSPTAERQPAAVQAPATQPPRTPTPPDPTATATPVPSPTPSPTPSQTPTPAPTPVFEPPTIILPTVAPPTASAEPETPSSLSRTLDGINLKVNISRSLSTKGDVKREFISRDDLAVRIKQELDDEKEDVLETERLYKAIGVMDEEADLFALELTLLSEGVLGFYDRDEDTLYVVRDSDEFGPPETRVYVHEFVHGLQDQHFDLSALSENLENNSDGARAFRALREGDARLTEFVYASAHMSAEEFEASEPPPPQALIDAFRAAPRLVQRAYFFPYQEGVQFVFDLYNTNGFDAIDAAYAALPQSTEQVLHADKYEAGEPPIQVVLPDVQQSLGEGWTLLSEDTLGEFFFQAYLEATLTAEDAAEAAAGWGGDRYALFTDPGERTVVFLVAEWDTEDDATEFANAFATFTQLRTEGEWENVDGSTETLIVELPEQAIFLGIEGQETVVIFAPGRATLEDARSAITRDGDLGG